MARIVIDDIGTRRRRKKRSYAGIFGTIFEIFSVILATTRLTKRFGRLFKKVGGSTKQTGSSAKSRKRKTSRSKEDD